MANHVRFIDDHCIDSEEIRAEMQKDIDRLVDQLEDQDKQGGWVDEVTFYVSFFLDNIIRSTPNMNNYKKQHLILSLN